MGISSALYSGVSGLNTDSQSMSVIGNNLANTSTVGFKGARTVFSDLLSSTIYGSGGTSQVGRGVNVSKVDNEFSQGTFQSTESGTDCAIEGSGFFLLKKEGDDTTYYSRAGAFRFDADGYLVNPEGLRVQGQAYDATGILIPGSPTDIQVDAAGLQPANVTSKLTLNTNLDASSTEISAATPFDYTNSDTFNYSSSTQVYDTLGNPHLVTVYFRKQDEVGVANPTAPTPTTTGDGITTPLSSTFQFVDLLQGQSLTIAGETVTATGGTASAANVAAAFAGGSTVNNAAFSGTPTTSWDLQDNGGGSLTLTDPATTAPFTNTTAPTATPGGAINPGATNTWNWYWSAPDVTGTTILGPGGNPNNLAGSISFNADGTLNTGGTGAIAAGDLAWANGSSNTGIAMNFNTTQFNSDSVVISQSQDGYGAGNLTGVTIDDQGAVTASYSNGVLKKISNLVLGKFNATSGLEMSGNNMFVATAESGTPRVGLPGSELGKVFTNSLEQSNVDMGAQFVEMITVQRAFQANSKIITTVDQLLNDVINMKQ